MTRSQYGSEHWERELGEEEGRGGDGREGRREGRKEGEGEGRERGRGEEGREGSVGGLNVTDLHKNPLPSHVHTFLPKMSAATWAQPWLYLVSTLVPEFLSTHPFFMGKEPDVDDPACIPLHPHCHVPWLWGTRDYWGLLEITEIGLHSVQGLNMTPS